MLTSLKGITEVKVQRGFGLAGESPWDTMREAAIAVERAGFESFWLSQPANGSTLTKLNSVAKLTRNVRVGVGAIPLTRESPEEIVAQLRTLSFPMERLRLGIGSGAGAGSLIRLRQGVELLRSLIDVEIVVSPLGPKMCRLAGEVADTVLFTWITPSHAERSLRWVRGGAICAGRRVPPATAYVRCAMETAARSRLETECARYGSIPHYAAHFGRQGVKPIKTTILANSRANLEQQISAYESVLDHVVVRAFTSATHTEILQLVEISRP